VIELGGSIVKAVGGLPLTERDIERLRAVDGLAQKLPAGCLDAPKAFDSLKNGEEIEDRAEVTDAEQDEDSQIVELIMKGGA
jgi:hypothetical protein